MVQYNWILGVPAKTDNVHYVWSLGTPFIRHDAIIRRAPVAVGNPWIV